MIRTIGFLELTSIAKGIEVSDAMLKAAQIEVYMTTPTCPGKYIILVYGDLSSVENAIRVGVRLGGEFVVEDLVIANVEEQIFPALTGTTETFEIGAVGIIECLSISSLIEAADASTKEANVKILEIRLGSGIGGKAYVTITGDVADVKAGISSGVEAIKDTGSLAYFTVIPSPHENFKQLLF